MRLRLRRADAQDEEEDAPVESPRRSPYKLASYEHDVEGKRFKSNNVAFSFWSATKYVFILSIILWWLPMFGQMIAGYVGGRRAGGPWKGVLAAILPVVCIYAVMTGFESGILPSHVFGVAIAPAAVASSIRTGVPVMAPYVDFSTEYVGAFVSALSGASPYGINLYVLTVAFAYVGGILAEQSRRELEFNSGSILSNTTVLVHDNASQQRAVSDGEYHHGFIPALASMVHWPWWHANHAAHPHHAALPPEQHPGLHRKRDPWANAQNLVYVDRHGREVYALPPAAGERGATSGKHRRTNSRRRKAQSSVPARTQRRRGRPNRSAKPRSWYPQYEWDESEDYDELAAAAPSSRRRSRRPGRATHGSRQAYYRKAKKRMDREWALAQETMISDDGYAVPELEFEEEGHHHSSRRRKERAVAGNWDTI